MFGVLKRSTIAFSSSIRRLTWLGAALATFSGSSHASAPSPTSPLTPPAAKSIADRIAAVRSRIAQEGEAGTPDHKVLYRLSQFFNFPNFPNFQNFPNFPNFSNFPNFPKFPKF